MNEMTTGRSPACHMKTREAIVLASSRGHRALAHCKGTPPGCKGAPQQITFEAGNPCRGGAPSDSRTLEARQQVFETPCASPQPHTSANGLQGAVAAAIAELPPRFPDSFPDSQIHFRGCDCPGPAKPGGPAPPRPFGAGLARRNTSYMDLKAWQGGGRIPQGSRDLPASAPLAGLS